MIIAYAMRSSDLSSSLSSAGMCPKAWMISRAEADSAIDASEVSSILDIARAYRLIGDDDYHMLQDMLLQVVKMLYALR